jgi:adenosylcobinamide-GDP ribazoletransferase
MTAQDPPDKQSLLARELEALHSALTFLTRLPLPAREYRQQSLGLSSLYFPLVGVLVALVGSFTYGLAQHLWSTPVACVFALAAMILCTGGVHEDGLADTADGIGGGWSKEDKLRIMKDSRIGTYGALALILSLLLKFAALLAINPQAIPAALVIAHAVGRWSTLPMLSLSTYVSGDAGSGRPFVNAVSYPRLGAASLFVLALLLWLAPGHSMAILLTTLAILLASRWYLERKIGGITGDTLGAINQLVEISVYLVFAAGSATGSVLPA